MSIVNITNFRKNVFEYLENTIKYNEPLSITTKEGNAVLISEDEYLGLLETLYLTSNPMVKEKILAAKEEDLSECVSAEEVKW